MLDARIENEVCRLSVSGDMTIYTVAELKEHAMAHMDRTPALELDLCEVGELDSAGFQLLWLIRREALANGAKFSLVAYSQAVARALELLGVADVFQDASTAESANRARGSGAEPGFSA